MLSSVYLVARQQVPMWLAAMTLAGGIAIGLVLSAGVLVASGVPLGNIVDEFILYVFFDRRGLGQMLTAATPLILVGLSAAAALKIKFWNVGIDGQVWLGAVAATWIAINDIGPDSLRLPLMLAAGAAGGALWLAVPAICKLRFGINEIIATLLLSYVAFLIVQHLLYGVWRDPTTGFPVSALFDAPAERLARLGWGNVHSGLFVALVTGVVLWFVYERSRFGFYVSAVGASVTGALGTGVPVAAITMLAAALSGGLSGLAGAVLVAGQEYRLTQFVAENYTFSGIVIAFIARFRIAPVLVAAVVVGAVYTAGDAMKVFYQLPAAVIVLIEAIVLLSVLIVEFFGRYHIRFAAGAAS